MKSLQKIAAVSLVFATAAILSIASARSPAPRQLKVSQPTYLQGASIPEGKYSLKWVQNDGSSDYAVTVQDGKKVMASATGKTVTLEQPSPDDAVIYKPAASANGSWNLVEIRFAGKAEAIRIEPQALPQPSSN